MQISLFLFARAFFVNAIRHQPRCKHDEEFFSLFYAFFLGSLAWAVRDKFSSINFEYAFELLTARSNINPSSLRLINRLQTCSMLGRCFFRRKGSFWWALKIDRWVNELGWAKSGGNGGWVGGGGGWVGSHPPPPTIGIFEKEAKWWEMVGFSRIVLIKIFFF